MMTDLPYPICVRCHKRPEELPEYVDAARDEETDPVSYTQLNEGTYNPVNGYFYCTECYVNAGMPLGVAR